MTALPYTRAKVLEILQRDHERFVSLVNRLSEEEQQQPFTPEGWSMKDFLSHMTLWKKEAYALLVAYVHDQPLPTVVPDGDQANEEQRQRDMARSLQDIQTDWKTTHTHLQHIVIDELDDTKILEAIRVPWDEEETEQIGRLIAGMCGHDKEHFTLIEQHFSSNKL